MEQVTQLLETLFTDYFLLSVFAVCVSVGYIIKSSIKAVPNDAIPAIVGLLGVVLCVWAQGEFSIMTIATGFFSGLTATGGYEFWKYVKEKLFGIKDTATPE